MISKVDEKVAFPGEEGALPTPGPARCGGTSVAVPARGARLAADVRERRCGPLRPASSACAASHDPGPTTAKEPAAGSACGVCRAGRLRPFAVVDERRYGRCDTCGATLLDPSQRPGAEAERACYLEHRNDPDDPRYRRFLSKLYDPLLQRLPARARVLDYGCGPGSALAAVLREAGHEVALYDPFFAPDRRPLERRYDGIVCSEAAEHFHEPAQEFDRLAALLRPGGWLGVMTCFQTEDARFAGWHYRKDPTHVVFYRAETLRLLAAQRGLTCEIPVKDVALFRRRGATSRPAAAPEPGGR